MIALHARARWIIAAIGLSMALALSAAGCADGAAEPPRSGPLTEILGELHAHSLAVDPEDPQRLLLGIHGGLYVSGDGGRTWRLEALEGADVMNLAGGRDGAPIWVAGHEVLARSSDGAGGFEDVRPSGLPGLDLHGFAVREGRSEELYAAVAGEGLYRSEDGARSFALLTRSVGASVHGMGVTADGTLIAADPAQGLLIGAGDGRTFRRPLRGEGLVDVALAPEQPGLVLAAGPGLYVSRDGGRRFTPALPQARLAAVAIAPSDPDRAYAIRDDGAVFTSADGARTWSAVEGREG